MNRVIRQKIQIAWNHRKKKTIQIHFGEKKCKLNLPQFTLFHLSDRQRFKNSVTRCVGEAADTWALLGLSGRRSRCILTTHGPAPYPSDATSRSLPSGESLRHSKCHMYKGFYCGIGWHRQINKQQPQYPSVGRWGKKQWPFHLQHNRSMCKTRRSSWTIPKMLCQMDKARLTAIYLPISLKERKYMNKIAYMCIGSTGKNP